MDKISFRFPLWSGISFFSKLIKEGKSLIKFIVFMSTTAMRSWRCVLFYQFNSFLRFHFFLFLRFIHCLTSLIPTLGSRMELTGSTFRLLRTFNQPSNLWVVPIFSVNTWNASNTQISKRKDISIAKRLSLAWLLPRREICSQSLSSVPCKHSTGIRPLTWGDVLFHLKLLFSGKRFFGWRIGKTNHWKDWTIHFLPQEDHSPRQHVADRRNSRKISLCYGQASVRLGCSYE